MAKSYRDEMGTYRTQYLWRDGSGAEHAFIPVINSDKVVVYYCDEDGLGLTLKTTGTSGSYEIHSGDCALLYTATGEF